MGSKTQAENTDRLAEFAVRLKAAMSRRGVKLREVADAVGRSVSTVGSWTQGKNWPEVDSLLLLAKFVDASPDWLLSGQAVTMSVQEARADYVISRSHEAGGAGVASRSSAEMVNPRHKPVLNPTPQDCLDYFEQYLARAESETGGIGYAWRLLQKHFPLDEFEPSPPKKENP